MAKNWKAIAKHTGITVGEIGVMGASIILTKKFLDARILFKNAIEKDPTIADKWYIKHQGAIKIVGGAIGASMIKNPWLKMVMIGVALEGFITEAVVLSTNKSTGVSFFDKIGASDEQIDAEMIEATKGIGGYGDRFDSTVAGYGDRFDSTVAGWRGSAEQMPENISTVTGVAGYF